MNSGQPGADRADLLTRTTLRLNDTPSAVAVGKMIAALQRVPGVLFAEIAAGADRAVVAHDAAVPAAALLEAAAQAGLQVKVVNDTRPPAAESNAAQRLAGMSIRRFTAVAAAVAFGPLLLAAISPHLSTNRFFLPIVLASVWAFFIARSIFGRRPKHP